MATNKSSLSFDFDFINRPINGSFGNSPNTDQPLIVVKSDTTARSSLLIAGGSHFRASNRPVGFLA